MSENVPNITVWMYPKLGKFDNGPKLIRKQVEQVFGEACLEPFSHVEKTLYSARDVFLNHGSRHILKVLLM